MNHRGASLTVFGTSVVGGSGYLVAQAILNEVGPLTLSAIRFILAGSVLLLLCRVVKADLSSAVFRLALWPGLVLALAMSCGIIGLKGSLSTIAAFLVCSDAFFIPLVDRLLFGRRTTREVSIGLLIGGSGIALLTLKPSFKISISDCWLLASAVFWAAYTSTVAHAVGRQAALPVSCASHLIAGLLVGVFALSFEQMPSALSTQAVFALLYFALVISALRFTLMAKAQQSLTPSEMGLMFLAEPVAAALFGYLVAREVLSVQQWIGASLVCVALLVPVILSSHRDRLRKWLGLGHA